VPVTAAAIEGGVVVERLLDRLPATTHGGPPPDWVVDATTPPDHDRRLVFGRRCVVQAEVPLQAKATSTAWIETVRDGWVHVAPVAPDRAVVQCMVPGRPSDPAATLGRMIAATAGMAGRIGPPEGTAVVFGAAPTLTVPCCAPAWIAVADGAVSLDPLSGLGTAWALRGGILAAAVIDGISSGLGEAECLGHYTARLREALHSHVEHCLRLYGAAFSTPAWNDELRLMAWALETQRHRHPPEAFGLRLNGLRLEPGEPVARAAGAAVNHRRP
jgi:flavin-dependent dehydrogenase